MGITELGAEVAELRDGVIDPELKGLLAVAANRLVPGAPRLTILWVGQMLRDEGNRAACQGRDSLGATLVGLGYDVGIV
jgi:hypothetical protein